MVENCESGTGTSARHRRTATLAVFTVLESALAAGLFANAIPVLFAIAIHLTLVAALASVAAWQPLAFDSETEIFAVLAALFAGPVGCLGLALSHIMVHTPSDRPEDLATRSPEDPADRLSNDLRAGRTCAIGAASPKSFISLITTGTLSQRLSILGVVALDYHPDYLPVLRLALRNDSAAVRAQAAALATTLRMRFKAELNHALAAADEASDCRGDALERLVTCMRSGFLEPRQLAKARTAVAALCRERLAAPASPAAAAEAHHLLLRMLHDEERHAEVVSELANCERSLSDPLRQIYLSSLLHLGRPKEVRRILRQASARYTAKAMHTALPEAVA